MLVRVILPIGIGFCRASPDEDVNVLLLQTKAQVSVKASVDANGSPLHALSSPHTDDYPPGGYPTGDCGDKDPVKCDQIVEAGNCMLYPEYADLCPDSCFGCKPPPPVVTGGTTGCEDKDPGKCEWIVAEGYCLDPTYAGFCDLSCFGCQTPPPPVPATGGHGQYYPGYGQYKPDYGFGPFGKNGELLGGGHWHNGRPYSSMDEPYERYGGDGPPCKPCPPGCCYDFEKPPSGPYGGPYDGPHGPYYVPHGHDVHVDGFIEGDLHVEEVHDYHGPHGPPGGYHGPPGGYHDGIYLGPYTPGDYHGPHADDYRGSKSLPSTYVHSPEVDWQAVGATHDPFLTDSGMVKPGEYCLGFITGPLCDKGYMCVDKEHLEGPPMGCCAPGKCKCEPNPKREDDYLSFAKYGRKDFGVGKMDHVPGC